jgi:hypothetical protein
MASWGSRRDATHGVAFVFEEVGCVWAVDDCAFGDERVEGCEDGFWGQGLHDGGCGCHV